MGGDIADDEERVLVAEAPGSEPFADAVELGAPPALTDVKEYIEDTDMRFGSRSVRVIP